MQQIWYLSPPVPLADAIVLYLDRAGVSFSIVAESEPIPAYGRSVYLGDTLRNAEEIAREIIHADGKEFVPLSPGEAL